MKNTKLFLILIPFVMLFSACKFNTISREAEYKVSHYLQNAEDDGYTLSETETLKGLTGSQTEAAPKEYEGFTALNFSQKPVSEGIEIEIKYDRNIITCALDYNGGTVTKEGVETKSSVVSGRYGTKIVLPEPVKEGYSIENWTTSDGTVLGDTFLASGTYSANYVKKADGQFKVTYSFQNLEDDDYSADTNYPDEVFPGMKGETTNVIPKAVKGFVPETVEQKEIAADGSTVIEVKYARKLVTLYISLNNAVGKNYIQGKACKDDEKEKSHLSVVKKITSLDYPTRVNFVFEGYEYDDSLVFSPEVDETTPIKTKWRGLGQSLFRVRVYQEKIEYKYESDKYELIDEEWFTGKSGDETELSINSESNGVSITAQRLDDESTSTTWNLTGLEPCIIDNTIIEGTDTAIANVYFDRKIINYTFDMNGGRNKKNNNSAESIVISGKYGTEIKTKDIPEPLLPGFNFVWREETESGIINSVKTFDSVDKRLIASWEGKNYVIRYHNGDDQFVEGVMTYNSIFADNISGISETGHTLGGWSRNKDLSSADYKVGEKFLLNDEETYETSFDLYSLWNTSYTVKYYKENADGIFNLVTSDTEVKSVVYTKNCTVSENGKTYDGYYEYLNNQDPVSFDNSTIIRKFYTTNQLNSSASQKIQNITMAPVELPSDEGKYRYDAEVNLSCTTKDAIILYTLDDNIFKVAAGNKGKIREECTLLSYGVKDGLYCSSLASEKYVTYLGTKLPDESKTLYDVCFSDGSRIPYSFYCTDNFAFSTNQKNESRNIIFYVGSESDPLGERTLGVYVNDIDSIKLPMHAYYTNKESTSSSYRMNDSVRYALQDCTNGYNVWNNVILAYDGGNASRYKAYNEYAKNVGDGKYYIPAMAEAKQLFNSNTIPQVNQILGMLGKGQFRNKWDYLTVNVTLKYESSAYYINSKIIDLNGNENSQQIQLTTVFVTLIYQLD